MDNTRPVKNHFNPAQSLILEFFHPDQSDHILILEGGSGWLAAEAARLIPKGTVLTLCRDAREFWAAKNVLTDTPNATTSQNVLSTEGNYDFALLTIPKERRYARTLLLAAWQSLKPGGRLLLTGPTRQGAKAVIKDAERLFGNATVLGYRNHQRIAACIREAVLPDPLPKEFQQPGIAPGTAHMIEITRPGGKLFVETHPGIFSWDNLDEGTALLLDHMNIEAGSRVWDVGCGYGAIGLSAALAGAGHVSMSDVNLLAVQYSQQNAIRNKLTEQVTVFPADGLTHPQNPPHCDLILSNPAFHQGRKISKSMADSLISDATNILTQEGRLLIVANRFLDYDKFMRTRFNRVNRIAETNKFHVIEARN